ncbi:MAG: heliorhodopsin HeR [Candidatus Izemoplasmataceae bacterium]
MTQSLIPFNRTMGFLHLIQGTAILVLALTVDTFKDFKPTVYGRFLEPYESGGYGPVTQTLFDLPFGILVAVFLLLSALFHFLISGPLKTKYLEKIEKGINPFRWYEYALSSSIMIVLLAAMFGLLSIEAIVLIFVTNALMNLFGLLMEKMNPLDRQNTDWTAHVFGWVAGITPWVLIVVYMLNNGDLSKLPWFVIPGLLFYFLTFNLFAFNQYFQYKQVGPWKRYFYGERMYVWLSLFGKSILAWFVFIGILFA